MDFSLLEQHAKANIERQKIPGCVCFAARGRERLYHEAFGYLDYDARTPLVKNAMFRLASMSKPVTGAVVMALCERGLLSLDDPVSKFLPGFAHLWIGKAENGKVRLDRPASTPITLRHLLSHCSGLGSGPVGDAQCDALFAPRPGETLADVVPRYDRALLDFEPQSTNAYSAKMAFELLSYLCELAAGMPFDKVVKHYLLDPLETDELTFLPTPEQTARMVVLYGETDQGLRRFAGIGDQNFRGYPRGFFSGAAALLGSAEGYFRFAAMLACGGKALSGQRVLSEESVRCMRTPAFGGKTVYAGDGQYWGLSMRVVKQPHGSTACMPPDSFGWSGAYGTHFFIDPYTETVAIYLMNCATANGAGAVTAREFEADIMNALGGARE